MFIPTDRMTPKERMAAFASGETLDRLPCEPFLGQNSAPYFGYSSNQFNKSAEVMTEVSCKLFETIRPDCIAISPSLQGIPEALGAELSFPEVGAPIIMKRGIEDYAQVEAMSAVDPYQDGRLPLYLEALQCINQRIGNEAYLSSSLSGPFTAAVLLCGTEGFLKDLIKQPQAAHRVLALTTQSVLNYMDAVCDLGFSVSLAEPLASCSVISHQRFNEFVKPYLRMITLHMKKKYDMGVGIHICGRTQPIWSDIADIGFSALSLDNIEDLAVARESVGARLTLIGNVTPVDTILNGSVQDVLAESASCIRKAGDNPRGFILGSGCEIPAHAPIENILAMMDAVRIAGAGPFAA